MTPQELVRDLRACGDQDLAVIFQFVADRFYTLQIRSGLGTKEVKDAIDAKMALEQLSEAAREPIIPPRRYDDFCPDCGHLHADDSECGFPQGGGRVCRCERKVTA